MHERNGYAGKVLEVIAVAGVTALVVGCAGPAQDAPPAEVAPADTTAAATTGAARATATLRDAGGRDVGTATFVEQGGGGVDVEVTVSGLSPGRHGVHVHGVGVCDASSSPLFSSAGDHFNPSNRQHGLENAAGPHAGDMPNLEVGADGSGRLSFTNQHITLGTGANSLFDADGSALVVHASADDQTTDPSGNSGDRIACGVVERA